MSYQCQECGRLFDSKREARKAYYEGCPHCGGTDIKLPGLDSQRGW